jgi:hypothetical protein
MATRHEALQKAAGKDTGANQSGVEDWRSGSQREAPKPSKQAVKAMCSVKQVKRGR